MGIITKYLVTLGPSATLFSKHFSVQDLAYIMLTLATRTSQLTDNNRIYKTSISYRHTRTFMHFPPVTSCRSYLLSFYKLLHTVERARETTKTNTMNFCKTNRMINNYHYFVYISVNTLIFLSPILNHIVF